MDELYKNDKTYEDDSKEAKPRPMPNIHFLKCVSSTIETQHSYMQSKLKIEARNIVNFVSQTAKLNEQDEYTPNKHQY